MAQNLSFVETSDGSKTIYNASVGENYHSKHGALQESKHVFLNAGLLYYLSENGTNTAHVLEIGFGTGLNFLVTANYCIQNKIRLIYTGIEAFPLTKNMVSETGYDQYIDSGLWNHFLNQYENALNSEVELDEYCRLHVSVCKLLEFKPQEKYQVVYFDAFAAIHQPEMWNEESIIHACKCLIDKGIFVTYAITGNLKRMMKNNGFVVQKIPGAAGKREMLRAIKKEVISQII